MNALRTEITSWLARRPAPSPLPFPIELVRKCASVYLRLSKNFRVVNADAIPTTGPLIIVANHTAAYDPVCLQVACKNRHIRFMEAREYYDVPWLHGFYRAFGVIPVNRTGNDTASVRASLRVLANGGCIGIFPEGRISGDGRLHEAQHGVALLALASNAVVLPAYLHDTRPYSGMVRDFLRFNPVTLHIGQPIRFDDLVGRHGDKQARQIALKRIMDAIIALQNESGSRAA